jgi:plastocyanin
VLGLQRGDEKHVGGAASSGRRRQEGRWCVSAWGVALAGQLGVTQNGFAFLPRTTSAAVSTTVTWSIASGTHTVTSDTGLFDSGTLSGGQSFSFNFTKPGTYNYHCNFHVNSGMVGTITIPGSAHDFNGDNFSDIIYRDNNGNTYATLLMGTSGSAGDSLGAVPTTWSIVGQRDFDGDSRFDLLWRDSSGNTAIWFLNGTPDAVVTPPRRSATFRPSGR